MSPSVALPSPAQTGRVRAHFEEVAPAYASFYKGSSSEAHSFRTRLKRVMEMLPSAEGTIVDIGCGPGVFLSAVVQRGDARAGRLVGMDFAASMLREAQQILCDQAGGPAAFLLQGTAHALPLRTASVDVAVCMGLMEYLDDQQGILQELSRSLRPAGTLIITLPNCWSPYRLWHRLLNRCFSLLKRLLPDNRRLQKIEFMVGPFTKGVSHREYSEWAYRLWLKRHGFEPIDVCYYNFKLLPTPLDKWFPGVVVSLAQHLERFGRTIPFRFAATAFILKARKRP